MRHAGLVAFLLVLSGCVHTTDETPPATQGAGGAILESLPSNMTLAILRPDQMVLLAAVDGKAVLINAGPAHDELLTDWLGDLQVAEVSILFITNAADAFTGGCPRLTETVRITMVVAPPDNCGSTRSLDSLKAGQVLQVGHISVGILSIQPFVATLDYGAVRILVAPEPACPTLDELARSGLRAPDLLQTADASCHPWDPEPATITMTGPHGLEPGLGMAFSSDGTALVPR